MWGGGKEKLESESKKKNNKIFERHNFSFCKNFLL